MEEQPPQQRGAGRSGNQPRGYYPKGETYLLVIGIDEYQDFPRLYNAVKDARDVRELLTHQYQFTEDQTTTLYNGEATQQKIIDTLRHYVSSLQEDDSLLVYFSGHGEYDQDLDVGYWIPADGRRGNIGSFLSFDMISKFVKAIHTHHTFVIADSCYAGSMFVNRSRDVKDKLESLPSRWLLTAGRNEVVSDGQQGKNSPFADAVLYHLRHNEEPRLEVSKFCNAVITDVGNNANQLPQANPLFGVGDRGGQFMFRLKAYAKKPFEETKPEPRRRPQEADRSGHDQPPATPAPEPSPSIPRQFNSLDEAIGQLKERVATNEFQEVLKAMSELLHPRSSLSNDLILLRGQFSRLQDDQIRGVLPYEHYQVSINKIRQSLIHYIGKLKKTDLKEGVLQAATPAYDTGGADLEGLERGGLEKRAQLLQRKINFFQAEKDKLSDASQKFTLEMQIEEAQHQLDDIKKKLG